MCKEYYESLKLQPYYVQTFWHSKNLKENDYEGLSVWYLTHAFNSGIMQPLEDVDPSGFRASIHHVNFREYCDMIWKGDLRDDLEQVHYVPAVLPSTSINYPNTTDIYVVSPENMSQNSSIYEKYLYIEQKKKIEINNQNTLYGSKSL
jgi:hypothetical protein